jgi:hypothetical protein
VVWSRQVERLVAQTTFEPLPVEELPAAWSRAIQQAPLPASSVPAAELKPGSEEPAVGELPPGDELPPGGSVEQQIDASAPPSAPVPDQLVIRPSSQAIPRYRSPRETVEPDRPVDSSPRDLDLGEGI